MCAASARSIAIFSASIAPGRSPSALATPAFKMAAKGALQPMPSPSSARAMRRVSARRAVRAAGSASLHGIGHRPQEHVLTLQEEALLQCRRVAVDSRVRLRAVAHVELDLPLDEESVPVLQEVT